MEHGYDNSTKQQFREHFRSIRANLAQTDRVDKSLEIMHHLLEVLHPYSTIMTYVSKEPEVDTLPLIRELLAQGKQIIVPIIQRKDCSLRLSYIKDPSVLKVSTFHVPEPIGSEIPANPADIEAAVIPLLGFDSSGGRIGYGAGYYDRFFAQNPNIIRIGIGFSSQEAEHIPCEPFDMKMHYVVTEKGIKKCQIGI